MAKRNGFGYIRTLASGRFKASYLDPNNKSVRHYSDGSFPTKDAAREWLTTIEADIIRKTWKAPGDSPNVEGITLREYALDWLRSRRSDLKPRTLDLYASQLDKFILPHLGDAAVTSLRPLGIKAWYVLVGTLTGLTARAQSYRLLRAILNEALRDEVITTNPCVIRGGGQDKHPERKPLAVNEIAPLAEGMPARYRFLVYAAAWSGLREGELLALRRQDVVADGDRVELNVTRNVQKVGREWLVDTPKTAAGTRVVCLPPHLVPMLEEHMSNHVGAGPDSLVFGTSTGGFLAKSNLARMFKRAKDAIGRPDLHFHDLRHTAATLATRAGATTKEVMARIGHASPAAANIYQHAERSRDVEIADLLSAMALRQDAG